MLALLSLVETPEGQGFLVGRSIGDVPHCTVQLFDRRLIRCDCVRVIDPLPIDHPALPAGMRPLLEQRLRLDSQKSIGV